MLEAKRSRVFWIDNLRALALISMIGYHLVWDLVWLYGVDWSWYHGIFAKIWQQSICWTFILLSGFCWSMSKNPLKQGLTISLCGGLVTVVTLLVSFDSRIIFGVLTLLGAGALMMIPLKKIFEKIPAGVGIFLTFLLFLFTYGVNDGYLGFPGMRLLNLPKNLYTNLFTAFLGFPADSFFSTDYFPIVPWSFLYMTGYFLYRLWKKRGMRGLRTLDRRIPVLTFMGRKSLPVYLLHQPVICVLLELTFFS